MTARRHPARHLLAVLAALLTASAARAQSGTSLARSLAPVGDAALGVQSPDVRGHGIWRAGLVADHQRAPFVLLDPEQRRDRVVEQQTWLHLQGSFALWHRLLLAAQVPVLVTESGSPGRAGEGPVPRAQGDAQLGDAALLARARLLGPAGEGEKLAVAGELWTPTGSSQSFAGGDGVRGRLAVVAGGRRQRFVWSVEPGVLLRGSRQVDALLPMRLGSSITFGAAAAYLLDARRTLQIGPEVTARSVFAGGARLLDPRSTGAEFWLSARYRPGAGALALGAAGGPGIGGAIGIPDYRALLSVAWAPERRPPPPDRDGDGVPDAVDVCPDLPGVASSDPVMHGCPELPPDRDGDSIPDAFDACPDEPGEPTGDRRTHGCPYVPDRDGDGIPDGEDACPDEPGVRSEDPETSGCPPAPPPPPRAELSEERIEISEQVHFETGTAVIREESHGILSAVARVLQEHPELELVEVRGHTDDTGPPELNRTLSLERATSVVRWLVSRGVAADRLRPRGFGPDRPIADNATEEGRALNRRVEFVVVGGDAAAPKWRDRPEIDGQDLEDRQRQGDRAAAQGED